MLLFLTCNSYGKGLFAPDFSLKDENGKIVHLYDLKGNIVMLSFCSTHCKKCKKILPEINRIYNKYKDKGVKAFIVVIDTDDINKIRDFKRKLGINIPCLIGTDEVLKRYRILGTPSIFVLNRELRFGLILLGLKDPKLIEKRIKKLLEEK